MLNNKRPPFDALMQTIADYVVSDFNPTELALSTATDCLIDTLGCGQLALEHQACARLLGPYLEGEAPSLGCLVPGTQYRQDPVKTAFDIGVMNRWLDYNDTWLAQEWGHPSDNFAALLAVSDWLCQQGKAVSVKELLVAAIKAYEIQGVLALDNSFNAVGFDHVLLVKLASCATAMHLLGGTRDQILSAISQCWVDGQSLRTYRHSPNTGSRKSWAAGDASARALQLAWLTLKGEEGYPSALTAPIWGFEAVSFGGQPVRLERPLGSYVMENILFKIRYPAEFHAQTAIEAAITLHGEVNGRVIKKALLETQEAAMRIIHKTGPLHNPADRDHCLEYMVAVALLDGNVTDASYSDERAGDPEVDALRDKMEVVHNEDFTQNYFDLSKRAIPNSLQLFYQDGSQSEKLVVEYPVGHRLRRDEGAPLLREKAQRNYSPAQVDKLFPLWEEPQKLFSMQVSEFLGLL